MRLQLVGIKKLRMPRMLERWVPEALGQRS